MAGEADFTRLDEFPLSDSGHLGFLEWLAHEIDSASQLKRDQIKQGLSNEFLNRHIRSISDYYPQARRRLSATAGVPDDAKAGVVRALNRELTLGTVERVHEMLDATVRHLREEWENRRQGNRSDHEKIDNDAEGKWVPLAPGASLAEIADAVQRLPSVIRRMRAEVCDSERRSAQVAPLIGDIQVALLPAVSQLELKSPEAAELLKRRLFTLDEARLCVVSPDNVPLATFAVFCLAFASNLKELASMIGDSSNHRQEADDAADAALIEGSTMRAKTTNPANPSSMARTSPTPLEQPLTPDGPQPPNQFLFRGKCATLQPLPWRLLSFLWTSKNRTALTDDVVEAVWGAESTVSEGALKSAISRANDALLSAGIPLETSQKAGHVSVSINAD
jgi:hypothetical protein